MDFGTTTIKENKLKWVGDNKGVSVKFKHSPARILEVDVLFCASLVWKPFRIINYLIIISSINQQNWFLICNILGWSSFLYIYLFRNILCRKIGFGTSFRVKESIIGLPGTKNRIQGCYFRPKEQLNPYFLSSNEPLWHLAVLNPSLNFLNIYIDSHR